MSAEGTRIAYWGRTAAIVAAMLVGGIALRSLADWRDGHAILVNSSESLPNWAFVIEKNKQPRRGDYVFFTPPRSPLVMRHFGMNQGPFGKIVYGLPGELVEREGNVVRVNGVVVGALKPLTRAGEFLEPGPVGLIPRDCYYVGTPHKDGFDSRYKDVGYACRKAIIGTGWAVL